MTKDEAFNKLAEAVEQTKDTPVKFENVEEAFINAARALNFIMGIIDGSESTNSN